jgi:hypothetical protein
MRLYCFLSRFVRRLSVRTSRTCTRPYGLNGALTRRFVRLSGAGASHKVSLGCLFLLHQLPCTHDIWLTPHFKTLQSP